MKRTKAIRVVIYLFALTLLGTMTEGCKSSKNCGCGSDISAMYKPSKRYR
ncbi:MAG: hypothetical protein K9G49_05520 [Taibaiella sp.]|nr:hypothetical protein [Taibaiella sp.]